jgi:hypothetical protein
MVSFEATVRTNLRYDVNPSVARCWHMAEISAAYGSRGPVDRIMGAGGGELIFFFSVIVMRSLDPDFGAAV